MRLITILEYFCLLYWCPTNCTLDERLRKYIKEVLKQYEKAIPPVHIHAPICVTPQGNQPNAYDYLIPKIILWDPLAQVTDLNGQLKCRRAECKSGSSYLRPVHWKDGQTQTECWRFLYSVDGPVFLISRVYRCNRQH